METKRILSEVPDYTSFLTLEELNKRAFELSEQFGFEIKKTGHSANGNPIYLLKAGNGGKNALVFGFPHPNEPIGSLTVDWLINYFGNNPEKLDKTGYTWYFIYTIDPDGTKLNEGWFKGELTIRKYFLNYYRPPGSRQIEWTFPVKYKDFEWKDTLPETEVIMKLLEELKPDLMYPLHNYGFGGAYFFSTKKFDDAYYNTILDLTKELGIPLHLGEPEEEFMAEIRKPFYYDFGCKEYYEQEVKLGRKPAETLNSGDNSTGYLLRLNSGAVVIKCEVPYFFDKEIINAGLSDKTRRQVWLEMIGQSEKNMEFYSRVIPVILKKLNAPDPHYYIAKELGEHILRGTCAIRNYVISSSKFDRKATYSEIFDCREGYVFATGLTLGQLRRAAIKAKINKDLIQEIEEKIESCSNQLNELSDWETIPIQKLVQLQLLVLFETLNALSRQH